MKEVKKETKVLVVTILYVLLGILLFIPVLFLLFGLFSTSSGEQFLGIFILLIYFNSYLYIISYPDQEKIKKRLAICSLIIFAFGVLILSTVTGTRGW